MAAARCAGLDFFSRYSDPSAVCTPPPARTPAGLMRCTESKLEVVGPVADEGVELLERAGIEEFLYPAMEDRALDLMIGEGPSARSVRIDLPRFTLIGATTENPYFEVNSALLSRSQIYELEPLSESEHRELVVVASCGGPAQVGQRIRFEAETLPDRVRREVYTDPGIFTHGLTQPFDLVAPVLQPFSEGQVVAATARVLAHYRCVLDDRWRLASLVQRPTAQARAVARVQRVVGLGETLDVLALGRTGVTDRAAEDARGLHCDIENTVVRRVAIGECAVHHIRRW